MTGPSMVAICDILGFSNLVKRSSLSELRDIHLPNILNLLRAGSIPANETKSTRFRVGHAFFSDTVLLYSLSDDKYGYQDLISIVAYLIAHPILHPEYRFRAGISYGEFYCDPANNVYAGKALVESHELEKKQDWCGGALTKTAGNRANSTNVDRTYLTCYDVPMHEGKSESLLAINWTQAKHDVTDQEYGWLTRDYAPTLTDQERDKIERKIVKMEQFHLDICNQCKAYRNYLRRQG